MLAPWKKIAASLFAAVLLNAGAALAQNHQHSHDHENPAQLTLDDGKKWPTDNSLRQSMNRIRNALEAKLPDIHSGKATAKQYRALTQKVNGQIAFIMKNCKLEPKVDAMLHLVLADIIAGAEVMAQGSSEAHKGAEKIAQALGNYGAYFDHPGWRPLAGM